MFRENRLRMSFVIVIYSSVAFIVGGPVNEQVRHILGFALGFPLMLFAIYAVIWLIRDREWREAAKRQIRPNKPRHDNPYQPPCFDDLP